MMSEEKIDRMFGEWARAHVTPEELKELSVLEALQKGYTGGALDASRALHDEPPEEEDVELPEIAMALRDGEEPDEEYATAPEGASVRAALDEIQTRAKRLWDYSAILGTQAAAHLQHQDLSPSARQVFQVLHLTAGTIQHLLNGGSIEGAPE